MPSASPVVRVLRWRVGFMTVFERICRRGVAAGLAVSLAVTWVSSTGLSVVMASDTPAPSAVTVAGSLQSELGCSGDWQPECTATQLAFDAEDGVWQRT